MTGLTWRNSAKVACLKNQKLYVNLTTQTYREMFSLCCV